MKRIESYLLENTDELMYLVSDINSWNGSLEYLNVYNNDEEFFNMFYEGNGIEIARAITYGNYNYMDEYVMINMLGNLDSYSHCEYIDLLKTNIEEIIEELIEVYYHLDISCELEELIAAYLEEDGE